MLSWSDKRLTQHCFHLLLLAQKQDSITSREGRGDYPCRRLDMQPHVAEAQMAAPSHCLTVLMLTNGADVLTKRRQRMKLWSSFILTHATEQAQWSLSL